MILINWIFAVIGSRKTEKGEGEKSKAEEGTNVNPVEAERDNTVSQEDQTRDNYSDKTLHDR